VSDLAADKLIFFLKKGWRLGQLDHQKRRVERGKSFNLSDLTKGNLSFNFDAKLGLINCGLRNSFNFSKASQLFTL
jgi:hypothetical protein